MDRFAPDDAQAAELSRTFGCVRKVYNLALETRTAAWYPRQERSGSTATRRCRSRSLSEQGSHGPNGPRTTPGCRGACLGPCGRIRVLVGGDAGRRGLARGCLVHGAWLHRAWLHRGLSWAGPYREDRRSCVSTNSTLVSVSCGNPSPGAALSMSATPRNRGTRGAGRGHRSAAAGGRGRPRSG